MPLYLSEAVMQSGASVKHTFIQFGGRDEVVPRRRTQSVPALARVHERDLSALDVSGIPDDDGLSMLDVQTISSDGAMECDLNTSELYTMQDKPRSGSRPTSAGTQFSESTASGTSDQKNVMQKYRSRPSSAGTWSSSGSQVAETACAPDPLIATDSQLATEAMTVELSEQVAEVIRREFGFLRLCCHRLQPGKARAKSGQTPITLYFYVHGLPWAKRSKWRQPLLWSFAAILAKNGITTSMMSGQLRAWPEQTYRLQVDIAAAREGRDF